MVHGTTLLIFFKAVVLVLGGLITYFGFRAYDRTGAPALRALTIGFGVVTVGSFLAGGLDLVLQFTTLLPWNRSAALVLDSFFTALGFLVILYSLYVE